MSAWIGLLDSVDYGIIVVLVGRDRQEVETLWHLRSLRSCPPGKSTLAGFCFGNERA
jgi:hypothetical protein